MALGQLQRKFDETRLFELLLVRSGDELLLVAEHVVFLLTLLHHPPAQEYRQRGEITSV